MTVTKKVFATADEAQGQVVDVTFSISGAEEKYCTTGFHVNWDNRLTVVPQRGGVYGKAGDALEVLSSKQEANGASGVFFTTMGSEESGLERRMHVC